MNKNVYVVGGDHLIEAMFVDKGWSVVRELKKADLVQFTGGADVSPELYGEENLASYNNPNRDRIEQNIYLDALKAGLPMAGICRGGQFLNVMAGGKMYQDVDGHAIGRTHPLTDLETGQVIDVTSTHHQEMIPTEDAEVIATANLGGKKLTKGKSEEEIKNLPPFDTEVLYYERDISSILCFQPHPEYQSKSTRDYFFHLLDRHFGL